MFVIQLTGVEVYVKTTLDIYGFQSLQGQFSGGFHFFILFLKTLKLGKLL